MIRVIMEKILENSGLPRKLQFTLTLTHTQEARWLI